MSGEEEAPKIHIDSDWKQQAQAEKQKLDNQTKESGGKSGSEAGSLPPANFETLLTTLATQALFAMGAVPDPRTGQRIAHLDLARHHIDMLTVIEEKTKGNLSDEESNTLATTLFELRQRYVQLANSARSTPTS